MNTYCPHTISHKVTRPLRSITSLSFTIPFQPSMWDDKSTQSALAYTTHIIETKLKSSYSNECIKTMLNRLKQLFSRLNFNTRRKSIAVIISADSEKLIYLNFPVRLFVSVGNSISILDLVTGIKQEIGFYLLCICNGNIKLYEYFNERLNIVYEQKADAVSESDGNVEANAKVSYIIAYMNRNYQKPVFFVGSSKEFNCFQNNVSYPEIVFSIIKPPVQNSAETMHMIETTIVKKWSQWLAKFHIAQIAMAKRANTLIFNYGAVLQALCGSKNGLLLMNKRVKKELHNPATGDIHFQDSKIFISQVEKFIDRGNCIAIKECGMLKDLGGIVLLPDTMGGIQNTFSVAGYPSTRRRSGNLFL